MTRSETGSGTPASANSFQPALSNDGRFIAFTSTASNLAGAGDNATHGVFLRDHQTNAVELISAAPTGARSGTAASDRPALSADGRYVVFASAASNLVAGDTNNSWDVFARDLLTETTTLVSVRAAGGFANGRSARDRDAHRDRFGLLARRDVLVPVAGITVGAVTVQIENQLTVAVSVVGDAQTAADVPVWVVLLGTGLGVAKSAADICICLAIT